MASNKNSVSSGFKSFWPYSYPLAFLFLAFTYLKLQSSSILGLQLDLLLQDPVKLTKHLGIASSVHENFQNVSFEEMHDRYARTCPQRHYQSIIFSTDPLIIYLENFLTFEESRYIIHVAEPLYQESPIGMGLTEKLYNKKIRSSQSAVLPSDPVIACIERRSVDFQGFQPLSHLEDLQVVRYEVNDQFRPHYDWASSMKNPRVSTIFAYLGCEDCIGGSTQFPRIEGTFDARWCRFIDCDGDEDSIAAGGIGFKPLVGNAVFWSQLHPNGTGHEGVWHAGMPVRKGKKYGMNIMTRRNPY